MALVKDSLLLHAVRGTLGDEITIYERNGQIIMAKKRSKSKKKPTMKQLEAREKLQVAAAYAKAMLKDPELKAYYKSKAGPGQNAYNMAIRDAYKSPEVQDVRLEETTVIVTAKDEFRVAEVDAQIYDADGKMLERGKAVLSRNGVDWHYKIALMPANGKIVVSVIDLPGNATEKSLLLSKES